MKPNCYIPYEAYRFVRTEPELKEFLNDTSYYWECIESIHDTSNHLFLKKDDIKMTVFPGEYILKNRLKSLTIMSEDEFKESFVWMEEDD